MSLIGFEEPLITFIVGIYSYVVSIMGADLTNFFIMALAIAAYAIILGTFYKTFSREKFFVLEHEKGETTRDQVTHIIAFFLKYTLAFPIITFVWFLFLSLFLTFLGSQSAADVMYIAIAVVAATRVTAYWDEGIAEDLAKMLPLGLLAFFIGNPSSLGASSFEQKFFQITQVLPTAMEYFVYIVLMEWVLRIAVGIKDFLSEHKERIVPAPVLNRIPTKMPSFPKKVKIPGGKKAAPKPAQKAEAPKKKGKKGSTADWDLEG